MLNNDNGNQTAQVASQQGKYIGKKLRKLAESKEVLEANIVPPTAADEAVGSPFHYSHLGNLAYIGNAAVFDFGVEEHLLERAGFGTDEGVVDD
jgi:NADH dehydrogenase FAD-containing subunit